MIKHSLPSLLLATLFLITPTFTRAADDSRQFDTLSEQFLEGYHAWRPGAAVYLGLHEYDGKVADRSKSSIAKELARLKDFESKLSALDEKTLDPTRRLDLRLLLIAIRSEIFDIQVARRYQANPMSYVLGDDVNVYIERDFAPLEQRLQSVIKIENAAQKLVDAAKENLDDTLPKPFVDTAILSAKGAVQFLEHDLPLAFAAVKDQSLLSQFNQANASAAQAMRQYTTWLETQKLPKATAPFALRRENYARMLHTQEMITLLPEEILEIGLKQIKREQEIFKAAARKIDPSRSPSEIFSAIQKDHPTADNLIPDTRRDLESCRQFVVDHHLVTIPSEQRATVKETPGFLRSSSFASMSPPGPFETKAKEAIYYVTPVEPDWSAERKEQWLTAFNYYTLDVVSIHEAYPGHYVQFLHLNASPATRIQKIFGSYAFVEGWAHYCEQMLLDEGFGADADPVRAAKFRITQSSEALVRLCRLCCSIQMHCNGMSVEEATKFFQNNCYCEEEPARQEATRGTFDPGYLYYTIGKLQFLKLREDYRAQEGANFSLQKYHDAVLSHGTPPIKLLRELVLTNPSPQDL